MSAPVLTGCSQLALPVRRWTRLERMVAGGEALGLKGSAACTKGNGVKLG